MISGFINSRSSRYQIGILLIDFVAGIFNWLISTLTWIGNLSWTNGNAMKVIKYLKKMCILSLFLISLGCVTAVQQAPTQSNIPSPPTIKEVSPTKNEVPGGDVSPGVIVTPTDSFPKTSIAQESVGQWEMYEITLSSTVSYENPFTDVEVYADFVSSGEVIRVFGFYDGNGQGGQGNLWKIRFMTGKTGTWSWETSSTDTTNAGLHNRAGSVSLISSSEPGPVSPDPKYPTAWRHANGEYFFWNLGYSIHMLGADRTHPGVGGWQDYLDWLQDHYFNGVLFTLQVESFDACSTCAKGMAPWEAIGNNPPPEYAFNNDGEVDYFVMPWAMKGDVNKFGDRGGNTDFSRFYLPFWLKVDEIVSEMQDRQMIAHIMQYDDQTFWPSAGSQEEIFYWNYIIRRLGAYWNIVYNDGIDLEEYRNLSSWVPEWQQYFRNNDPFGHARSSRHGDDDPQSASWRSMQAARPNNLNNWRGLMNSSPQKPVTEDDGVRARNNFSPERFMQLAWWSVLSGPGGFGVTWAGGTDPGNWYSNLDADNEGMLLVEHRTRFILDFDQSNGKQIPFWKLQPRDDLISGANSVYCAAVPGKHYLVYFDAGSSEGVTVNLQDAVSSLHVTWLNPQTGQRISAGTASPGGAQEFTKPFAGPSVLYIGEEEGTSAGIVMNVFLPIIKQ